MTDTPALLPPDPDRPGRYWPKPHWGDDIVARWNPSGRYWNTGEFSVLQPRMPQFSATPSPAPHPIPGPAALEAIYAAAGQMHREKEAARRTMNRSLIGGYDWREASTREAAFMAAYDMLRAALETKEDDKND